MNKQTTHHHPVEIGSLAFSGLEELLVSSGLKEARKFILVDENSLQYCFPVLVSQIEALRQAELIEIESGEHNKNITICTHIWEALSDMQTDRQALFINLGGGVISDMGGFIASTYKRGIRFINIPTTLLSQVDASVGAKVGIDLNGLKNQIGLFAEPLAVFIDPVFLSTLPTRELLSGFAEVIKHALIADKSYWELILNSHPLGNADWEPIIQKSVAIKQSIVEADPTEKGFRKVLNFGHTIGHAVESLSLEGGRTPLTHGESVAIGMICESYLSERKRKMNKEELSSISTLITSLYEHRVFEDMDTHRLIELMKNDKKNKDDSISFTLLDGIGKPVHDLSCTADEISDSFRYYHSLYR
ncbi:MAG TPA: 3-dehydroquinate synthase [Flavobacteriales bacterium]|nr:3-dehydroquinate synthase [Flavobacteriales bacterium]HRE95224.1 3-dehydroquinate synthase [Flavobacteriales bacterium]HRJ35145.1 3-dehydroquinate synthase [Flavobacteriales bacterium]HRJ40207.1 3-dehydroquinate synthase [Flavobacteriales bacterium]